VVVECEIVRDRYTIAPDKDTQYVIVRLPDGRVMDVKVAWRDPVTDEIVERDLDEIVEEFMSSEPEPMPEVTEPWPQ